MKDQLRKALADAITARFAGRINLKHGQKQLAAEFSMTQPDVSICSRGEWSRMSTDKLLDIAGKLGIGMVGVVSLAVLEGSEQDEKFVSVVEAKEKAAEYVFEDGCPE